MRTAMCGRTGALTNASAKRKGCVNYLYYIVAFIVPLCVYSNSVYGGLVFDDHEAIETNIDVRTNTPLASVFKNDFWGNPLHDPESHKSYRPLTILTFRWNYWIHGLSPYGYHIVNIILHAIVCVIFLFVLIQVGLDDDTAFITALLFGCHPIHTEAVANIVGRAEILSSLFYLLSFSSFLKYLHSSHNPDHINRNFISCHSYWIVFTVLLSLVALLCKEQGITVLGICLIYDLFIIGRISHSSWISSLRCYKFRPLSRIHHSYVLLISAVGILSLRLFIIQGQPPVFVESDNPASFSSSFLTRVLTYSYLCWYNFSLLLYPSYLCFDWSMGSVPLVESLDDWRNIYTVLFFLSFTAIVIHGLLTPTNYSIAMATTNEVNYCHKGNTNRNAFKKGKRMVLFALVLMIIPFIPASNLFFPVGFVIAERVLYMPSMGFCLLVGMGLRILGKRNDKKEHHCDVRNMLQMNFRKSILTSVYLLILLFSLKTILRNKEWKDTESLALSGLIVNPLNAKIYATMGNVLAQKGERQCEYYYRESLKLKPNYTMAWTNLGLVLLNTDRPKEAEDCYRQALSIKPDHVNANINMAHLCRLQKRWKEALSHFILASSKRPNDPVLCYYIGIMYQEIGNWKKAEMEFDTAVSLNPHYPEAHLALGKLLTSNNSNLTAGNSSKAIVHLRRGLQGSPSNVEGHMQLAILLSDQGELHDAKLHLLHAIKLQPTNRMAYLSLASVYEKLGDLQNAEEAKKKANVKTDNKYL